MISILKFALVAIAVYAIMVTILWFGQEKIAFPAPKRSLPIPSSMGIDNARKISVTASDGVKLMGWYLGANDADTVAGGKLPALIWFYGNFETVSTVAPLLQYLRPPGWAMLAVDIRGYGESGGSPTEDGLYLDAEAAWEFLAAQPEIDPDRIAVFGRSLGTTLALHLAAKKPVAAVVLEAPLSSGREMAKEHYAWIPSFAVRLRLDNLSNAKEITAPLLVMHGADDTIVPLEMGRKVAEAGKAAALIVFDDAGHNDMMLNDPDRYRQEWMGFLQAAIQD